MLVSSLIPQYKFQLVLCRPLLDFPIRWDSKRKEFYCDKKKRRVWTTYHFRLCVIYTIILAYTAKQGGGPEVSVGTRTVMLYFAMQFALLVTHDTFLVKRPEDCVNLLNQILRFERSVFPALLPPPILKIKRTFSITYQLMFYNDLVAGFGHAIVVCLLTLWKPCKPPFLGYWVCTIFVENSAHRYRFIFTFGASLLQTYIWYWSVGITVFVVICTFSVYLVAFWFYSKGGVIPALSRNYYHQVPATQAFNVYSELRILVGLFNDAFSSFYILEILGAASCSMIIGVVQCIRYGHRLVEEPGLLIFPILVIACVALQIIICYCSGKACGNTRKLLQVWLQGVNQDGKLTQGLLKATTRGRPFLLRKIKSLPPLKVKLGSSFIETRTMLEVFNFCADGIASLLLVLE